MHRIILTGKNSAFPKTVRLPVGYRQDGSEATRPIQIRADECKCPRCGGWGYFTTTPINPSERGRDERCPDCEEGIAKVSA